jgi:uncharacterized protein (TIRG00374 family)
MHKVSIVVPAHNEEENLPMLMDRLVPVLAGNPETEDFELVFVNDNSRDGTGALIDGYAAANPRIKAIHRTGAPGFGNAIKAGFKGATGKIIIPVMADLSDDPNDIVKLVRKIDEGYDVAYGSRFCKGGATYGYPWKKMIANRVFNNSVRLMFGLRHRDVTNAFKAYRREVLDAIGIDNIEANGFDLTVEIPLKAHILGFKSAEVPVSWHDRKKGEAKLKLSQNGGRYGKRLMKMFVMGNMVSLRDIFKAVVKGSWLHLLLAAALGIVLLALIFTLAGFSEVFSILSHISPQYLIVSGIVLTLAFVVRTWRWSVLLRASGYRVHADTAFKCIMFGWLINYLLPARIGDIARGVTLKTTENTPLSVGLSTIVIERAMDMLVLAIMLVVAIFVVLNNPEMFDIAILTMVVALGLVVVLAAIYKYDHIIVSRLERWFPPISQSLNQFKTSLMSLAGNPMAIVLCLILSFPVWLLEASSIYFAAMAIHYPLTLAMAIVAGIVAFIVQAIPTTPGGIGVQEGTIAGVLLLFNINTSIGISIALLDHLARGIVIFGFGMISAIHIGFESRQYFAVAKNDGKVTVADELAIPKQ